LSTQETTRRKGRPPSLSRERILEVADTFTFDELSMPALAAALGVSQASLYYYFENRQALVEEMLESVLRDLELGEIGDRHWRELVVEVATATRTLILKRESYLAHFPASITVAALPIFERLLEAFKVARCSERQAVELSELVYAWCKFSAIEEAWFTENVRTEEQLRADHAARGIPLDSALHRITKRYGNKASAQRMFRTNLDRILETVPAPN